MALEVGDIVVWNEAEKRYHWLDRHISGPFVITDVRDSGTVTVRDIATGYVLIGSDHRYADFAFRKDEFLNQVRKAKAAK